MADDRLTFLRTAAPGAQKGAQEFGVPASVTLAQAILESAWGRSHIGVANNYFGIKAFTRNGHVDVGKIATGFVTVPTHEVVNGHTITVQAHFRRYRSLADSMRDHGSFLRANSRYGPCFSHSDDPNTFARALQRAGYATDPAYADKLVSLMKTFNLYKFDVRGDGEPERPEAPVRPSIAAVQRDLNTQLTLLGSPELLAVDGVWDAHTGRAFRRVCRVLGIEPKRGLRAYRVIAGATAQRTEEEIARAAADGKAFAEKLREKFAANGGAPPPPPPPAARRIVGGRSLGKARRRAAYIAALQRDLNVELHALGAPKPLEVDGEWGHETDRAFRRVCRILGLEPKRSVRTFRIIAGVTAARTAQELDRAAHDGTDYAAKLRVHFHRDLREPLDPDNPDKPDAHGRTFRIQSPYMQGPDIRSLQRVLNERFQVWKINKRVDIDGEYGPATRLAARQVAHGLGLAKHDYPGGITPEMRKRMRTPSLRSPEEVERAERRRPWLRRLRHQLKGGGADLAIAYARKHIGLIEGAGNRGPMIDKWNRAAGSPLGSFWCGNFCNGCLMAAGFPTEPWLANCGMIEAHAKAGLGNWSWHATPRPGDLATFTVYGAANHVGLVESVGNGQVVTIEGNTHRDVDPGRSNDGYGVFRRHHPLGQPRGYARPPYGR